MTAPGAEYASTLLLSVTEWHPAVWIDTTCQFIYHWGRSELFPTWGLFEQHGCEDLCMSPFVIPCVCVCVSHNIYVEIRGQVFESGLSPSSSWFLGTGLGSSGLVAGARPCWAILLTQVYISFSCKLTEALSSDCFSVSSPSATLPSLHTLTKTHFSFLRRRVLLSVRLTSISPDFCQ